MYMRTDPADILALGTWGEGLGADNSVAPHKRILLVDFRPPLLRPDHRGRAR